MVKLHNLVGDGIAGLFHRDSQVGVIKGTNCPELQRQLTLAQAVPIYGVLPSVAKAFVSVAQVFGNLAGSTCYAFGNRDENEARTSMVFAGNGLKSLGWSLLNIVTLGFSGTITEHGMNYHPDF